jgi:hypothetical protein
MTRETDVEVHDGVLKVVRGGVVSFEGMVEGALVEDAVLIDTVDLVAVLTGLEPGSRPISNLFALEPEGRTAWVAELPTSSGGECYVFVAVDDSGTLSAHSWSGYSVTLDPGSGKIIARQFVK